MVSYLVFWNIVYYNAYSVKFSMLTDSVFIIKGSRNFPPYTATLNYLSLYSFVKKTDGCLLFLNKHFLEKPIFE